MYLCPWPLKEIATGVGLGTPGWVSAGNIVSLIMDGKIKLLIAGDIRGNFKQLFNRVDAINKKAGPFEILICIGDVFGSKEQNDELIAYKNGFKHIAVPTYILGPNREEHVEQYETISDGEVCSNLTYLGNRGLYTMSNGLKIAYLSGIESSVSNDTKSSKQKVNFQFHKEDVAMLRNSCLVAKTSSGDYKGVDILITSQWPFGMQEEQNAKSSKLISFLSREIKPRYHFCGLNGKFYEPPPFRIPRDETTQLELSTRFISLAALGNTAKDKYIYALSLQPVEKMRVLELIQKTTTETKCPYTELDLTNCSQASESSENRQYFFDMHGGDRKRRSDHGKQRHDKRPRIMNIDQEKCWFCLSSTDVEKHLVISIGDNFYLALAKGPISDYHILIMPVTHISSSAQLGEDDWQELMKFKDALREFYKEQGQVVCFTERNYKSPHLQINALGIDTGYAWKIKHAFDDKAEEFNLQFDTLPVLSSANLLPEQGPYFVAELPDEQTLITRQMKHFPLHFARDVFCSANLLNCEEKVDWRDCKLDKDEEITLVQNFRKKFEKYDFTI